MVKRLRILWITSEYYPLVGGLERYVAECVDALSTVCEVCLFTATQQSPYPGQRVSHAGALNIAYPGSHEEFEYNSQMISEAIHKHEINVVHFASAGVSCYSAAIPKHVPYFVTVHCKDLTRPWQRGPENADVADLIRRALLASSGVFCVSRYTKSHVDNFVEIGSRSEVLHPGIGIPDTTQSHYPDETVPLSILTIAKMIPRKGHESLLRALEYVKVPFTWNVVGSGPHIDEFVARVADSPIHTSVVIHGGMAQAQLEELWRCTSLFAMTPIEIIDSRGLDAEGFGLVFLEAALRRIPVVASTTGGCAEAVLDGITGALVDPHDPETLAQCITNLLENRGLRVRLGRAGNKWVRRDFRWDDRVAVLLHRYETALRRYQHNEGGRG